MIINNNQEISVKIKPSTPTPFEFPIKNDSGDTVVVYLDKVSCSCTSLDTSKTELDPGETKIIHGTVNRSTPALFTPQVRTHINSPSEVSNIKATQYSIRIELEN